MAASTAFIGELGLGGELRAGRRMEARISEAAKLGFKRIIIPNAAGISNTDKLSKSAKIQIINCSTLKEAIKYGLVEEK